MIRTVLTLCHYPVYFRDPDTRISMCTYASGPLGFYCNFTTRNFARGFALLTTDKLSSASQDGPLWGRVKGYLL